MKNNLISQGLASLASEKIDVIKTRSRKLMLRHPVRILTLMLISIVISALCCFTILRQPKLPAQDTSLQIPVSKGEAQGAMDILGRLGVVMSLQAELKTLSGKDSLSASDSIHLENLLSRLRQLQNQRPYEKDKP
ncbi:hypothetical protein EZ449_14265 [Pedobacter frigidisoli]|uniref:Uncharacterized protein n=1 Tax=Pedobacter frigidisoli TaxID=2530455 RepID=A0A4R0P3F1_9SPHI|nr:hypothetical protein [Pedobacter frigidisoli]TCD07694.1 hypothetical protein EZ449_14265 [Pedobacter frigidisoli]